ncbi:glucosidase II beta subunit-like protein-domain-containing protein [Dipodascopsis tothii]|uniref:glucosidase II beta subunit-like protein-domain-containing protein n=1 Tax=Dipodascopsis tothii TaxID=44089 RepID=UPI0034CD9E7D
MVLAAWWTAGVAALLATAGPAAALFSVQDDILAFPQYQLYFADGYVVDGDVASDNRTEVVRLNGERYACTLPRVRAAHANGTQAELSKAEEEAEFARAQVAGWELLEPLEGTCLYYIAGWWTYSYCHNQQIKQFHQLAPQKGVALYPPVQDPNSEAYILGKVTPGQQAGEQRFGEDTAVQSAGEMRYLVQRIGGGTVCDLTGRKRRIEVQFHCNKQSNDKIAWIKEVTTCRYLMVIHTPRLCNDAAFLPPKEGRANEVTCRRLLTVAEHEAEEAAAVVDAARLLEEPPADAATTPPADAELLLGGRRAYRAGDATEAKADTRAFIAAHLAESRPLDELEHGAGRSSPDLVTSASILLRDIERQMDEGTFLTPEGAVATEHDTFSYSVALVDTEGESVGIVTVVVDAGQVRIELEQSKNDLLKEEQREGLLRKFPQKLRDELREFSGGANLEEISRSTKRAGRPSLWADDEPPEAPAEGSHEEEYAPDERRYQVVVRDEL